jgi:hypothetical protein
MKQQTFKLSKLILFLTVLCTASFAAKANEQTHTVTFYALGANGQEGTEFGTLEARLDDWQGEPITSGTKVEHGRTVRFEANPKPGYQVKNWYRNGEPIMGIINNVQIVTNLDADVLITVEFEEWTHLVTFSVEGGNGTLLAEVDEMEIKTGNRVMNSKDVVFKATPNHGYQVKRWFDGSFVRNTTDTTYTKSSIQSNVTVRVEFERNLDIPLNYEITFATINGNGTLTATLDEEPFESGGEVQEGEEVELTATPDAGFQIKGWTINGESMTLVDVFHKYWPRTDGDTWVLTMVVEKNLDVKVEFEHKGESLASIIAAYGDGETLQATFDLATSTVTVTSEQPVTNATSLTQYPLDIPEGVAVRWSASFSTNADLGFNPLIQLSGNGTFELVEGGFLSSTKGGAVIQSFAGSDDIAIVINGGIVQAGEDNAAIQLFGTGNASITVKAGEVLAKNSEAILVSDGIPITVSGGLVFAYGEDISDVIGIGFAGGTIAAKDVIDNGVVIAWNYSKDAIYDFGSTTDLTSLPEDSATWSINGNDHGIRYKNNQNEGLIVLPVTVEGAQTNILANMLTQTTPVQAWIENGTLNIKGLPIGKTYRIFTISGILVHQGMVTTDIVQTQFTGSAPSGTYIIHSETGSSKIVW